VQKHFKIKESREDTLSSIDIRTDSKADTSIPPLQVRGYKKHYFASHQVLGNSLVKSCQQKQQRSVEVVVESSLSAHSVVVETLETCTGTDGIEAMTYSKPARRFPHMKGESQ
jgi:hypothetical protein